MTKNFAPTISKQESDKDSNRFKKVIAGLAAVAALSALGACGNGDPTEAKAPQGVEAPASSGETPATVGGDEDYWYNKFEAEGPEPVYLTTEQITVLEGVDQTAKNEVINDTLMVLINAAAHEMTETPDAIYNTDLSSISDDAFVQSFVRLVVNKAYTKNGAWDSKWNTIDICLLEDGSIGKSFCVPGQESTISSGTDGEETTLRAIIRTETSEDGSDGNQVAYANPDIHYAVDDSNRLSLTMTYKPSE